MRELRTPRHNLFDALKILEQSPISLSANALERARKIAHLIDEERSPVPFLFPTEIGGVQCEWKGTGRELNLEILPDTEHLAYLTILEGQPATEGEIAEDYERNVIALLKWMRSR